jgi:two-component sensor histidine kinase
MKYGALSNLTGSILVVWNIEQAPGGDRLLITWTEIGCPPVLARSHKGFGSSVIERGLAHELQGTARLDFRPDGLVCTINIPAPAGAHNG